MNATLDAVCFGEALIDFFPAERGLPWEEIATFHRYLGGAPANVAVGLARLGFRSALLTLVGRDGFGVFLRRRLQAEGVDTSVLGEHPTLSTGVTFINVDRQGERSFLDLSQRTADQGIQPRHVDESRIAAAQVLHLCSSTLAQDESRQATWKAVTAARAARRMISFDPNLCLYRWGGRDDWREEIRRLATASDLVKLSREELAAICRHADLARGTAELRALGAGLVVVTLGAQGCYYQTSGGEGLVPGVAVQVMDSTGAGDAFSVGLLASFIPKLQCGRQLSSFSDEEVRQACIHGNQLGAQAVTVIGATEGLPRCTKP